MAQQGCADWVEQTTTELARTYDSIKIERLNTAGMTRRPKPKPDPDSPGNHLPNGARAKAALNRLILASRWGRIASRLDDKTLPGTLVEVPAPYTSQQCNPCGHTSPDNRESQAVFRCQSCGHTAHADTNAARNIRDSEPIPNPRTSGDRVHQPRKNRTNQPAHQRKEVAA